MILWDLLVTGELGCRNCWAWGWKKLKGKEWKLFACVLPSFSSSDVLMRTVKSVLACARTWQYWQHCCFFWSFCLALNCGSSPVASGDSFAAGFHNRFSYSISVGSGEWEVGDSVWSVTWDRARGLWSLCRAVLRGACWEPAPIFLPVAWAWPFLILQTLQFSRSNLPLDKREAWLAYRQIVEGRKGQIHTYTHGLSGHLQDLSASSSQYWWWLELKHSVLESTKKQQGNKQKSWGNVCKLQHTEYWAPYCSSKHTIMFCLWTQMQ